MSAWRSLFLLLTMIVVGMAMTRPVPIESVPLNDVSDQQPKSWGTMDGKSPFRLIADTTDIDS